MDRFGLFIRVGSSSSLNLTLLSPCICSSLHANDQYKQTRADTG